MAIGGFCGINRSRRMDFIFFFLIYHFPLFISIDIRWAWLTKGTSVDPVFKHFYFITFLAFLL